jgi:hypothetical protein
VPPRECRGLAHQDHADEKGDQPEGSEQDETRGHADAVAEDDHAEDDPGHRLRRGDAPQGGFGGAILKALYISHSRTRVTAISE